MDKYIRSRYRQSSPRRSDPDSVYHRQEVPLRSDQALRIHKKLVESFLNGQKIFDYWRLSKVESLENEKFEMEYSQIRNGFLSKGFRPEEVTSNLGFLATASDKMIKISMKEGLCVKSSPINTLGYCIAGVHLSTHADVCLQEAALELGGEVKELILVAFKFMYGRRNSVVPSVGGGAPFWSPTPGYNSHVSSTSPHASDPLTLQHSRSLVYLYEFENELYHPLHRPRHCCPSAALYFKLVKPLPTTGLASVPLPIIPILQPTTPQGSSTLPPALKSAVDLVTSDPAILRMVEGPSRSDYSGAALTHSGRDFNSSLGGFRGAESSGERSRKSENARQPLLRGGDADRRTFVRSAEDEPKPDIHSRLGPKRHPYLKTTQPWRQNAADQVEADASGRMTGGFRMPQTNSYEEDFKARYPPLMEVGQPLLGSRRKFDTLEDRRHDYYEGQSRDADQPLRKRPLLDGDGTSGARVSRNNPSNPFVQRGGANSNDTVHNRFKRPPLLDGPSAANNQQAGSQQSYGAKRERNRVGQQRGRATARKTLL